MFYTDKETCDFWRFRRDLKEGRYRHALDKLLYAAIGAGCIGIIVVYLMLEEGFV